MFKKSTDKYNVKTDISEWGIHHERSILITKMRDFVRIEFALYLTVGNTATKINKQNAKCPTLKHNKVR